MAEQSDWRQPPPEVEEILREHQKWRETGQGKRADFSNGHLEKINFAGRDLRQVIFRKAILRGANLQKALLGDTELQGADLQEAFLEGADLEDADLSQAILRNVDLSSAKHLIAAQIAGADLTRATVSREIQDFLNKPGNLDEVARLAGGLFVTVLSACAYIGLTVLSTTDAGLLTNTATSKLPILAIDIPIAWFYWLAPFLLLSMYMYFHLTLQKFWDGLAALPAKYPDGRRVDQMSYPWLLNALVGKYIPLLKGWGREGQKRKERSHVLLPTLQLSISIFFAWWVVPLMIAVLWFRYLTRHDPTWTRVQAALLLGAIWFGLYSWRIAKSTLQGQTTGLREFFRSLKRNIPARVMSCLLLALSVMIFFASDWVIFGIPPDPQADSGLFEPMRKTFPKILKNWFHYNPFADFSNAEVSLKPAGWAGEARPEGPGEASGRNKEMATSSPKAKGPEKKSFTLPQEEIARVKGAPLYAQDLRYAAGKRAFLFKAELQNKLGPDFRGADLRGASLPQADLRYANLEKAVLDGANLNNVLLSGAILQNASLRAVSLTEADLTEANLQGANFRETNLREAIFVKAGLQGAGFSAAVIQGADFRGAKGLERDQIKEHARLWVLAYYDDRMLKELNLPPDHNARLQEKGLSSYNFRQVNLEDADLGDMHLEWAKLQGANLAATNLAGATLRQANLRGAILRGAELRGTDFREAEGLLPEKVKEGKTWVLAKYDEPLLTALGLPKNHNELVEKKDLRDYRLEKAPLAEADLSQVKLERARLTGANLCKANFEGANLKQVDFTGAKLKEARFTGANVQGASFGKDSGLTAADFEKARFWRFAYYYDDEVLYQLNLGMDHNSKLAKNDWQGIQLAGEDLCGMDFSKKMNLHPKTASPQAANLRGADLRGANLKEADLEEADLQEARLEGATLVWANLKGAKLERAQGLKDILGARNWFLAYYDDQFLKSKQVSDIFPESGQARYLDHNARIDKKDLSGYQFAKKYLIEADFSDFTLVGTNFSESYLLKANFSRADLRPACFNNAFLGNAKFDQAKLSGTDLKDANVRGADFRGAQGLVKAKVMEAKNWLLAKYDDDLRKALGLPADHNERLEKKDLSGYDFNGKYLNNHLEESDFSGLNLAGAKFAGAFLTKADFSQAHLENAELSGGRCQEANLEGAYLKGAKLVGAKLDQANLRGADLSKTHLIGASLEKANLQGANLRGAILQKTNLKGADLRGVQGFSQKSRKGAIIDVTTKLP